MNPENADSVNHHFDTVNLLDGAIKTSYNTEEVGKSTLETLSQQHEQLKGVKNKLIKTDENISRSSKFLNAIKRRMTTETIILIFIDSLLFIILITLIAVRIKNSF